MATNFGTKIAINAHKCISTRDNENATTYNGVSWSTNPRKTLLIARVYRTLLWQPNFGHLGQKTTKMAITSVVARHTCRVWFWDGVCAIGEFVCDTPAHKGQRVVTMATKFRTKLAINAHKCISTRDNENAITYNRGFSWSTDPKKTFLIVRV